MLAPGGAAGLCPPAQEPDSPYGNVNFILQVFFHLPIILLESFHCPQATKKGPGEHCAPQQTQRQGAQNRRWMMKSIHVLLADDHTLVRSGLRRTLEQIAEVKVVAEASTGREVLQLLKTVHPDVVLMNIAMRDLGGLEATPYTIKMRSTTCRKVNKISEL